MKYQWTLLLALCVTAPNFAEASDALFGAAQSGNIIDLKRHLDLELDYGLCWSETDLPAILGQ